jgi:hypothetical protein
VPFPGFDSMSNFPESMAARSIMPSRPNLLVLIRVPHDILHPETDTVVFHGDELTPRFPAERITRAWDRPRMLGDVGEGLLGQSERLRLLLLAQFRLLKAPFTSNSQGMLNLFDHSSVTLSNAANNPSSSNAGGRNSQAMWCRWMEISSASCFNIFQPVLQRRFV